MAEPGRPSVLTKELRSKIRELVLDYNTYDNIRQILEIPKSTWDTWVNEDYEGFRAFLTHTKHERMVKKAEMKVETLIDSEDEKVATSNAQFTLKTLGKDEGYTERTDITSKGDKILVLPPELMNKYATNTSPEGDSGK